MRRRGRDALPGTVCAVGVGASGEYHIAGFGVLYVTGYNFGGQFKEPAGSPPCGGALRCISGYFTTGTDSEGEIDPDAEIRGLLIVKLIL